jgi:2-polyprenyl-3-methyl-5-hydroxy-6-metoxy-1,4-benzoquinol methylase
MSNVVKHYEQLLAEHYVWMFGISFEQKVAEQKAILEPVMGSLPSGIRRGGAIDLGSGPGFQSIALAELGLSPVIAVDTSRELLDELRAHDRMSTIELTEADLTSLDSIGKNGEVSIVVCMGDTLTHLPTKAAVRQLFNVVFGKLAPGGLFVLTYRDLTSELFGADRFLPVRADDTKIMTCFLEYKNDDTVVVNDLIYTRDESGWKLNTSSYEKLRLSSAWVSQALRDAGFMIEREAPAGRLLMVVAQKEC